MMATEQNIIGLGLVKGESDVAFNYDRPRGIKITGRYEGLGNGVLYVSNLVSGRRETSSYPLECVFNERQFFDCINPAAFAERPSRHFSEDRATVTRHTPKHGPEPNKYSFRSKGVRRGR